MPKVFDSSSSAVGAIQSAMIDESQFQDQFGTGWVLADGRSVAGSKYAAITGRANIPDLRGMTLRGKNNGRSDGNQNPDGDSALGTYQADELKQHKHSYTVNYNSGAISGAQGNTPNSGANIFTGNTGDTGGNETRVKNVTVNYFIRIN